LCKTKHGLDTFCFLLQVCGYLLKAIISGDVEAVKLLVKSAEFTCTISNEEKYTPLLYAAWIGRVDLVQALLDGGARIEEKNPRGWTALHVAAFHGRLEVCRLLLDRGAYVNALTSRKRNTPLNSAARTGHKAVVELLMQRGADTRYRNADNTRAFELAYLKGFHQLAQWLKPYSE
jgi:ankyrin repeat protein